MTHLTRVRQCPDCGHAKATRVRRRLWHRLFANSGLFRCNRCQAEYLVLGCCTRTRTAKA